MRSAIWNFCLAHVEKVVLAAAIVFLGVSLAKYLPDSPNQLRFAGGTFHPDELHAAILAAAVELQHAQPASTATAPEPLVVPGLARRFRAEFAHGITSAPTNAASHAEQLRLARAATWGDPIPSLPGVECQARLVTPAPPTITDLTTGRSLLQVSGSPTNSSRPTTVTPPIDASWISLTFAVDAGAQKKALVAAGWPKFAAEPLLVGIDIQRQALRPDGTFESWTSVADHPLATPAYARDALLDGRTGRALSGQWLREAFDAVRSRAADLATPALPLAVAGDPFTLPGDLAKRRQVAPSPKQQDRVKPPPPDGRHAPTTRFPMPRPPRPAPVHADRVQPARDSQPNHGEIRAELPAGTFVSHDAGPAPGVTYRYRARLHWWNRLAGRPNLFANPADAGRALLTSPWSEPSAPFTAAPDTHAFIIGANRSTETISVEAWKWYAGHWYRSVFSVGAGEKIAGPRDCKTDQRDEEGRPVTVRLSFDTRLLVLEVCQPDASTHPEFVTAAYSSRSSRDATVILADERDGSIVRRSANVDRYSPLRKRLQQMQPGFAAAAAP